MKTVSIGNLKAGLDQPLLIIAGPCLIESESLVMNTAESLKRAAENLPIQ
ncbi:MAG: 3-deoxy-8-phosphooctulonate synthase, partial [Calditrichaeota bacterium]|nr:3-deoxy-8-phosphooctulonate synthase [Calditrichota bacterium]